MRDRLIELLNNQCCPSPLLCDKNCKYARLKSCYAERVADYLLANGVIVPPVMLGQKVWEVVSWDENVRECRVSSLTQKADGTFKIRITNLKSKSVYERVPQHIGDIIFLTKEEAEQTLKGGEE